MEGNSGSRFQSQVTNYSQIPSIAESFCFSATIFPLGNAILLGSYGQAGLGLTLVLAFSLGLAGVLTAIGLTLVYARQRFEKMNIFKQNPERMRIVRALPIVSALCVVLLGLGLTGQALVTILDVRF